MYGSCTMYHTTEAGARSACDRKGTETTRDSVGKAISGVDLRMKVLEPTTEGRSAALGAQQARWRSTRSGSAAARGQGRATRRPKKAPVKVAATPVGSIGRRGLVSAHRRPRAGRQELAASEPRWAVRIDLVKVEGKRVALGEVERLPGERSPKVQRRPRRGCSPMNKAARWWSPASSCRARSLPGRGDHRSLRQEPRAVQSASADRVPRRYPDLREAFPPPLVGHSPTSLPGISGRPSRLPSSGTARRASLASAGGLPASPRRAQPDEPPWHQREAFPPPLVGHSPTSLPSVRALLARVSERSACCPAASLLRLHPEDGSSGECGSRRFFHATGLTASGRSDFLRRCGLCLLLSHS